MWVYDKRIRNVIYTVSGVSILFCSDTMYKPEDIFKIKYRGKYYYFEIKKCEILESGDDKHIEYTADEIGYWVDKLDKIYDRKAENKSQFDIRDLFGMEVELVCDDSEKTKILQENCWL